MLKCKEIQLAYLIHNLLQYFHKENNLNFFWLNNDT